MGKSNSPSVSEELSSSKLGAFLNTSNSLVTMSMIDTIYQRMQDPAEAKVIELGESELVKFYAGLNVFVTGGTEIIGKCIVEKLLRECTEIRKIYLLVRVKKGEDFEDKCKKYFNDDVSTFVDGVVLSLIFYLYVQVLYTYIVNFRFWRKFTTVLTFY